MSLEEETNEWGPGGQPSASKQIEVYNDSLSKNTPKKKGKKLSTLRYPGTYTDNRRDYLQLSISKFDRRNRMGNKSNEKPMFTKQVALNQKNQPVGHRFKVNEENFSLPNWKSFTESFNEGTGKNTHTYISLPIPENLQDSNQVSWNEDTISPLSAAMVNAGSSVIQNPGAVPGKISAILDHMKTKDIGVSLAGKGIDSELIADYTAALAVSQIAQINPQSIITRTSGQVMQSNMELLVDKPMLRQFNFTWHLMARDRSESQEILQIIRALKKALAMKKGGAGSLTSEFFLKSPDYFELSYHKGSKPHPFLNNFKPCALTSLSTNYTGSTTYSTYRDGTPTHISITTTFQEVNPIYAEDYDTGKGKRGVGY